MERKYRTRSAAGTGKLGRQIASRLCKGDIIAFSGTLGSGKTTLIKGIVKGLTGREATSPSFVVVNEYDGPIPVYHFDLYRLSRVEDLETIGWDDYLEKGIMLIEWADRIPHALAEQTVAVRIIVEGRTRRRITIRGRAGVLPPHPPT